MMDMIPSNFWWSRITGPNYIVNSVAKQLADNRSVFLKVPDDLPWRSDMRAIIETVCRQDYGIPDVLFSSVDVEEECNESDPGIFLLNTYAKKNQSGYRQGSSQSVQSYIINKRILSNRVIWVKGLSNQKSSIWKSFCEDYKSKSLETGLFVIELNEGTSCVESDNIAVIRFNDYVTSYDVQLFSQYLLFDNKSYSSYWREYISILLSKLCKNDGEIASHLISNYTLNKGDVIDYIKQLSESLEYTRRGMAANSDSLLKYAREDNYDEIYRRIWEAQLQFLFPLIESIRISIIHKIKNAIIPYMNEVIQYGASIEDPLDLEIGSLDYLVKKHFNDSVLKRNVKLLHDCRNNLAHRSVCDMEQINSLMAISKEYIN